MDSTSSIHSFCDAFRPLFHPFLILSTDVRFTSALKAISGQRFKQGHSAQNGSTDNRYSLHPHMAGLGILPGSLFSISISLLVVLPVFRILQRNNLRFSEETPELARSTLSFVALTVFAAGGLVG